MKVTEFLGAMYRVQSDLNDRRGFKVYNLDPRDRADMLADIVVAVDPSSADVRDAAIRNFLVISEDAS